MEEKTQVMPDKSQTCDLGEEQLDTVAGGASAPTFVCQVCGAVLSYNLYTEIADQVCDACRSQLPTTSIKISKK